MQACDFGSRGQFLIHVTFLLRLHPGSEDVEVPVAGHGAQVDRSHHPHHRARQVRRLDSHQGKIES